MNNIQHVAQFRRESDHSSFINRGFAIAMFLFGLGS